MKVPFTWKVTGWFMIGWSAEFPASALRPLRYRDESDEDLVAYRDESDEDLVAYRDESDELQEYIEHPALAKGAKPYMAMRKWALQFYEVPPATPPEVPAPV